MRRISLIAGLLWLGGAGSLWGADPSLESTLEYNRTQQASTWVDPDTGETGSTVPTRTFQNDAGQPCREFTQTILIAGEKQQGYGTACRQPDGSWQIVNDERKAPADVPVREREVVYFHEAPRYYYPAYPYDYYPYYSPFSLSLSFSHFFGRSHHHGRHSHGGSRWRSRW